MKAPTITSRPLGQQSWEFEITVPSGMVVAMDGSPESIAAFNAAARFARSRGCPLHVVSVLQPFNSYRLGSLDESSNVEELRIQLRNAAIRGVMTAAGAEKNWTYEVAVGRPANSIVRVAEERGADLIFIGQRKHGVMDRIMEGETSLQVMRQSSVPVLAVPAEIDKMRCIVVATDFSVPSAHAAKVALELLEKSGTLYLAHVEPPVEMFPAGLSAPGNAHFPGDVIVWFRRLVESLDAPPDVIVETVILNGKPAQALLEFAERVGADAIAAGSHGYGRVERLVLGSTSIALVRNAQCPVLVSLAED